MSTEHIEKIARYIVRAEGGYVDHPSDKGGATKFGITKRTWEEYCKEQGSKLVPVSELTEDEAVKYYIERYKSKDIGLLPKELQLPVFDFEVNAGRNAIITLQNCLNVYNQAGFSDDLKVDGVLGYKTAGDAKHWVEMLEVNYFCDFYVLDRIFYYRRLVQQNPSQFVFLKGWVNRAEKLFSWRRFNDSLPVS